MLNQKKVSGPIQVLSMDLVGPLPRSYSGHCHLLTVVDTFSKFIWLHPLKQANSRSIVKFLENNIIYVCAMEPPTVLYLIMGLNSYLGNLKHF